MSKSFDQKYERFVDREDVRNASFNLKKLIGTQAIILAAVSAILLYTILYNINRGDFIFPAGQILGDNIVIPYLGWHKWLENLAWTIGFIVGTCIAVVISTIIAYAYYRSQLLEREMDEFTSASSQAERDIEIRKAFKEKYGDLYEDIKEGRVKFAATAASVQEPTTVIKAQAPLPAIKMPPKIAIAPPSAGAMTALGGAAPPVPDDIGKKKKPSGPVEGEKKIYVRCERCNRTLVVNIPRKLVLDNDLEVVPVSIVHGEAESKHILTVFLDPDFKSRRDRISDMLTLKE